ncbi:MAG TPA: cell filamentation protein Fic [Bacteroidetes bacterium]|nr:cell filamentation protein Fic [Bacteroidota bacterium]
MKYESPNSEHEILPNKLELTNLKEIGREEYRGFLRAEIKFESELEQINEYDWMLICTIHKTALGHLYDFAGKLRSVNISKGGFLFPAAQHLDAAIKKFEQDFLKTIPKQISDIDTLINITAPIHAELLFIHPFREGNGRTIRFFTNLIALKHGFDRFNFEWILENRMNDYIAGVQAAADKNYEPMISVFRNFGQQES